MPRRVASINGLCCTPFLVSCISVVHSFPDRYITLLWKY